MLVDSLIAGVNVAGGCMVTHKFDQMSMHRSMLDVLAVFNDLCLLIREKHSQQELAVIVKDLVEVFGSDLSVLARLLPNIRSLSPQLRQSADLKENEHQWNLRNICFTLQHFIRVVSSGTHPVVLFLDDLQWCDKSVFTVVESLLCDLIGSPCVFFVGSYRSNEVGEDHKIFHLERRLRSFGVPTTNLSLEGLNRNDLNSMVSDALCMFPRISEPLSDIVYQKTKGNPFFVLAFLKSLVDERLLEYSIHQRRWVWDEDKISSMDVTDNVLHILSSKMSGLSINIQTALKVAACFGLMIKELVVTTLATDPKHSDIRDELEKAVKAGFMVKLVTSDFKFVHDKIREAAYSLIPESDKNQVSRSTKHTAE
jgi:predicted ATPase